MQRRTFLQSVAGLILWPSGTTPQPIIMDYEDGGYLVEVGFLHCAAAKCPGGSAQDFTVYVIDYPMPGMGRVGVSCRLKPSKRSWNTSDFPPSLKAMSSGRHSLPI